MSEKVDNGKSMWAKIKGSDNDTSTYSNVAG